MAMDLPISNRDIEKELAARAAEQAAKVAEWRAAARPMAAKLGAARAPIFGLAQGELLVRLSARRLRPVRPPHRHDRAVARPPPRWLRHSQSCLFRPGDHRRVGAFATARHDLGGSERRALGGRQARRHPVLGRRRRHLRRSVRDVSSITSTRAAQPGSTRSGSPTAWPRFAPPIWSCSPFAIAMRPGRRSSATLTISPSPRASAPRRASDRGSLRPSNSSAACRRGGRSSRRR